jgi:hypothetical protein
MERSKIRLDQIPLKPLRGFDFGIVNNKLDGFIFNVNRDLERKAQESFQRGHRGMETFILTQTVRNSKERVFC